MTNQEYLAFFTENDYQRSWLVKLLEQQVAVFNKNQLYEQAEKLKWWIVLEIAPAEKERRLFIESDA